MFSHEIPSSLAGLAPVVDELLAEGVAVELLAVAQLRHSAALVNGAHTPECLRERGIKGMDSQSRHRERKREGERATERERKGERFNNTCRQTWWPHAIGIPQTCLQSGAAISPWACFTASCFTSRGCRGHMRGISTPAHPWACIAVLNSRQCCTVSYLAQRRGVRGGQ